VFEIIPVLIFVTRSRYAQAMLDEMIPPSAIAAMVRRPLRPFWPAVLAEIYLRNVCSCQEILRPPNGRGGQPPAVLNGTEGFVPTLLHVYVRFGQWDEVLAYPVSACVRIG
jgi:hypothetical protein